MTLKMSGDTRFALTLLGIVHRETDFEMFLKVVEAIYGLKAGQA
jgi:hypothetical protein